MDLILQDSWRKANYKEIHLGGGTPHFFLQKFRGFNKWHFVHAKKSQRS
jgi:hypothetical protein